MENNGTRVTQLFFCKWGSKNENTVNVFYIEKYKSGNIHFNEIQSVFVNYLFTFMIIF